MADTALPAGDRVWIGASYALGRPVSVAAPYPHICGVEVVGQMSQRQYRLWQQDCAACAERKAGGAGRG